MYWAACGQQHSNVSMCGPDNGKRSQVPLKLLQQELHHGPWDWSMLQQ